MTMVTNVCVAAMLLCQWSNNTSLTTLLDWRGGDTCVLIMSLHGVPVHGVLSDISGVLSESSASGDGVAIAGSVMAIDRLRQAGIKVRRQHHCIISEHS